MKKIIILLVGFITLYGGNGFITAKELRDSFDYGKLIVIDVSDSYKIGHIDGSIHFDVHYLIDKTKSYQALKSHKRLLEIFGDLGLSSDAKIVLYSRNDLDGFKKASFLAFVLTLSGFEDVVMLDGAYMAWVFEYPELITNKVRKLDEKIVKLEPKDLIIDSKTLLKNIKNINLIDARDRNDFDIANISGATNCSLEMKFKADFTIKNTANISYMCLGYFKDKLVTKVVYADDIFTSSLEWYILYKVLGFKNTKIYYGGFWEYKDLGY